MAKGTTRKRGPKDIEMGEKFKKNLPCPISGKDAHEKADEIVDVLTEITVVKEKRRPFNDKIKELVLKVESLRNDIKTKTEEREVLCQEERDFKKREVRVRRLDTKEVVESRTMNDEDRQEELADLAPASPRPTSLSSLSSVPDDDDDDEDGSGEAEPN